MKIDIGIPDQDRARLAENLGKLLADTYTLYLKTLNFHWNVTGPMFQTLHLMFEQQYTELAMAIDMIAERVRALGHFAPGSYAAFSRLSTVPDSDEVPPAERMIRLLVEGHEIVIHTARQLATLAEEVDDQATLDLATERLQAHEKTAWMLRSLLEGPQ
jgi:starvation-inducible DNA-binding protein